MGELYIYQLQASSPVTSRVHQTFSAVTGVTALTYTRYNVEYNVVSVLSLLVHFGS